MAPTTLIGMKATTAPMGRDPRLHGYPLDISRMIALCEGVVYVERCSLASVKHIKQAKKAIRKAFQCQLDELGYALVELLSPCPTNWKMSSRDAWDWTNTEMTKTYPLGVLKDTTGYEAKK